MININSITDKEKAIVVCLYYAQINSNSQEYKGMKKNLELISSEFDIKYNTLKNIKDKYDPLYNNGRKGWHQEELRKQGKELSDIHEKYKEYSIEELKKIVEEIIKYANRMKIKTYTIKTSIPETVEKIKNREKNIEISQLNVLKESLKKGQLIFLVFGGDRVKWKTGLAAIVKIVKEPYDENYHKKNYKIQVEVEILFDKPITKEELIPYLDIYGISSIGPAIKGTPNQAITVVSEKQTIALIRAIMELSSNATEKLGILFTPQVIEQAKDYMDILVKVNVKYGDKVLLKEHEETYKFEDRVDVYDKEEFLKEVFISDEEYDEMIELIEYKKNIILEGPPGVGKTFLAKRLAYSILGKKSVTNIKMIQFHQSYSYEDFICGFRPTESGFKLNYGPFYEFCKIAENNKEDKYFFIIDEINRGNMSKIFGELLMLIESDKRNEEINILYHNTNENNKFKVPSNIYIIGTMNTADRSIAIMDYALRRRFSFYTMESKYNVGKFKELIENTNNKYLSKLVDKIKKLNVEIRKDESLGKGFEIGHSYFCFKDKDVSDELLKMIVKYEICPLIREYWIDDNEMYEEWERELKGVFND